MVERGKYLSKLIALRDQHIIKVVTGIRRCGKSTLLQMFRGWLGDNGVADENIVSLNFEERESQRFATWENIYDFIIQYVHADKMNYVFLDEVQMIPHFERLVDALFVKPNVDLYITGSNAYMLSSELGTLLSGRYIAINLQPFSFSEYV